MYKEDLVQMITGAPASLWSNGTEEARKILGDEFKDTARDCIDRFLEETLDGILPFGGGIRENAYELAKEVFTSEEYATRQKKVIGKILERNPNQLTCDNMITQAIRTVAEEINYELPSTDEFYQLKSIDKHRVRLPHEVIEETDRLYKSTHGYNCQLEKYGIGYDFIGLFSFTTESPEREDFVWLSIARAIAFSKQKQDPSKYTSVVQNINALLINDGLQTYIERQSEGARSIMTDVKVAGMDTLTESFSLIQERQEDNWVNISNKQ